MRPWFTSGPTPKAKSKGIYLFRLQTSGLEVSQNITLVPMGLAAESPNPSFLELDPKRRLVFAVNEIDSFQGKPTGAVSAFAIDPASGKLNLLNQRASMGTGPCHLVLDKAGKNLLVANYGSGSVAVLPVAADGKLGEATEVVQHSGKSVHPERQKGPHAHCVTLDPTTASPSSATWASTRCWPTGSTAPRASSRPHNPAHVSVKPGAGPRHMVFRPDGRFAYVLNEMNSTVTAFAYDAKAGVLKELQTLRTLPEHYDGPNSCAEVDIHPSGKFLYASNRGHNSVVLFNVDPDKGTLTYVEEQGTGGKSAPALRHRAVGQAPGHRQPGLRQPAGVPDRRRQRPPEALGRVRRGAQPRLREVPARRPERTLVTPHESNRHEKHPRLVVVSGLVSVCFCSAAVAQAAGPGGGAALAQGRARLRGQDRAREGGRSARRTTASGGSPASTSRRSPVYLPAKGTATGAGVIILPGGGHRYLSIDNEGHAVARWLGDKGVAGFVLKYRLAREEGSTYKVEEHAVEGRPAGAAPRARARQGLGARPAAGRADRLLGRRARSSARRRASSTRATRRRTTRWTGRARARPSRRCCTGGAKRRGLPIPKDAPPAFICVASDDKGPTGNARRAVPEAPRGGRQRGASHLRQGWPRLRDEATGRSPSRAGRAAFRSGWRIRAS